MSSQYLYRWQLHPDGEPIVTPGAYLQPVLTQAGAPAMLKQPLDPAEVPPAAAALGLWKGDGAVRLLASDAAAMLLERIVPGKSLRDLPREGADPETTAILCDVVAHLHHNSGVASELVPLHHWFEPLLHPRVSQHGLLRQCSALAGRLLAQERNPIALHGDLHHDNVLDGGVRGWLAIDPKGLLGESAFDYAPLFLNPDLCASGLIFATEERNFNVRLTQVSRHSGISEQRLLQWIAAYAGLSASWFIEEGQDASISLSIAELSLAREAG